MGELDMAFLPSRQCWRFRARRFLWTVHVKMELNIPIAIPYLFRSQVAWLQYVVLDFSADRRWGLPGLHGTWERTGRRSVCQHERLAEKQTPGCQLKPSPGSWASHSFGCSYCTWRQAPRAAADLDALLPKVMRDWAPDKDLCCS